MTGVQILNEFEVAIDYVFSWNSFWIGALIGVGIAFIAGISFGLEQNSFLAFLFMFIFLGICMSILLGFFLGRVVAPKPIGYETHYEVSISEEVNMKEFIDKYEILETRGAIYTVKEK